MTLEAVPVYNTSLSPVIFIPLTSALAFVIPAIVSMEATAAKGMAIAKISFFFIESPQ
jgi:hypothetical protein